MKRSLSPESVRRGLAATDAETLVAAIGAAAERIVEGKEA